MPQARIQSFCWPKPKIAKASCAFASDAIAERPRRSQPFREREAPFLAVEEFLDKIG